MSLGHFTVGIYILVWYAVGLSHRLAVQTGYSVSIKGSV